MNELTRNQLAQAITYEQYEAEMAHFSTRGETSGPKQLESLIQYTKLNERRMKRVKKTFQIIPELEKLLNALQVDWTWLVLTESWCGDAAHLIPAMYEIAHRNKGITLQLLYRDQHLDIMDEFLTNGGRSIPKLICLSPTGKVLGSWGPRPGPAQSYFEEQRSKSDFNRDQVNEELQKWYNADRTRTLQKELLELMQGWNNSLPVS